MYQRILVPVDGSLTSDRGLDEAIALAQLTGARLKLVHVVDELSYMTGLEGFAGYTADLVSRLHEGGEAILAAGRERAQAAGLQAEVAMLDTMAGPVCDLVVGEARTWPADLIVLGTHGRRGVKRLLLGSDAERIVRSAPVPVLLVHGDPSAAGLLKESATPEKL